MKFALALVNRRRSTCDSDAAMSNAQKPLCTVDGPSILLCHVNGHQQIRKIPVPGLVKRCETMRKLVRGNRCLPITRTRKTAIAFTTSGRGADNAYRTSLHGLCISRPLIKTIGNSTPQFSNTIVVRAEDILWRSRGGTFVMVQPERPSCDNYDGNPQVLPHFSPAPDLTPIPAGHRYNTIDDKSIVGNVKVELEDLYRKHRLTRRSHYGLYWVGTPEQINDKDRDKTIVLVLELDENDIGKWRDFDAEARALLDKYGLVDPHGICVRYYRLANARSNLPPFERLPASRQHTRAPRSLEPLTPEQALQRAEARWLRHADPYAVNDDESDDEAFAHLTPRPLTRPMPAVASWARGLYTHYPPALAPNEATLAPRRRWDSLTDFQLPPMFTMPASTAAWRAQRSRESFTAEEALRISIPTIPRANGDVGTG